MKRVLLMVLLAAGSAFGTLLSDGEINELATGDGSTPIARQWQLDGGITMTVSGLSFNTMNGTFAAANTTQFDVGNIGLGVCGVTAGAAQYCSFNQWQLDNSTPGYRDFVLFTFSSPVNLVNFTVRQTGLVQWSGPALSADSDWSWATSTAVLGAANLSGLSLTDVDGAILAPGDFSTRTIAGANGIQSLLLGVGPASAGCATSAAQCDFFKLYDITVNAAIINDNSTVPEPASMALIGLGLIGVGLLSQRRRMR